MSKESVQDSFERCEKAGDFAETFYGIFLKKSPEISDLFAKTDFQKQHKLLRASVFILVNLDIENPNAKEMLARVGDSHSKHHLDIRPELYETWLNSLCETVKQMDPHWTETLEISWKNHMRPGIDLITSLY